MCSRLAKTMSHRRTCSLRARTALVALQPEGVCSRFRWRSRKAYSLQTRLRSPARPSARPFVVSSCPPSHGRWCPTSQFSGPRRRAKPAGAGPLQLMVGRHPSRLDCCGERGWHRYFVRVTTFVSGYRIPHRGSNCFSRSEGLGANRRSGTHTAFSDALKDLVRIRYAPHLRHHTTGWRNKTRSQQGLRALLRVTKQKEVRTGREADVHRAVCANGYIDCPEAHRAFRYVPHSKCHAAS